MRTTSYALMFALLLSSVVVGYRSRTATADEKTTIADADKVYPMTYRIPDLPVWSSDGKTFNPAILMAYLKTTVSPDEWNGRSMMAADPNKTSLIVATNSVNHNAIATAMKTLREQTPAVKK